MKITVGDKVRILSDRYVKPYNLQKGAICIVANKSLDTETCGVTELATGFMGVVYDKDAALVEPFDRGVQVNEPRPIVTEFCAECETEVELIWNAHKEGYKAFCPHCGARLMLCDECRHRGPGGEYVDDCDYDMETDSCRFNPAKEVS